MNDSNKLNANEPEHSPNNHRSAVRIDRVPSAGDWRELARLVQHETDPNRLSTLVQQLIAAIDREKSQPPVRLSDEREKPLPE